MGTLLDALVYMSLVLVTQSSISNLIRDTSTHQPHANGVDFVIEKLPVSIEKSKLDTNQNQIS